MISNRGDWGDGGWVEIGFLGGGKYSCSKIDSENRQLNDLFANLFNFYVQHEFC